MACPCQNKFLPSEVAAASMQKHNAQSLCTFSGRKEATQIVQGKGMCAAAVVLKKQVLPAVTTMQGKVQHERMFAGRDRQQPGQSRHHRKLNPHRYGVACGFHQQRDLLSHVQRRQFPGRVAHAPQRRCVQEAERGARRRQSGQVRRGLKRGRRKQRLHLSRQAQRGLRGDGGRGGGPPGAALLLKCLQACFHAPTSNPRVIGHHHHSPARPANNKTLRQKLVDIDDVVAFAERTPAGVAALAKHPSREGQVTVVGERGIE
mmetsp:Transcript_165019/g.529771  ORF Transcript_165019/g.529771 Transcript_165019/m.529771 type:complete len:261 (+) Transcript_165019:1322-2104(+)